MSIPTRAVTAIPTAAAPPATATIFVEVDVAAVAVGIDEEVEPAEMALLKSRNTGPIFDPGPLGSRVSGWYKS